MFASPARTIGLRARALLVGATIVALTAACSSTPAADPAVPPAPASTTATMPSGDASTAPGLAPPTASASAVAITIKDFAFDVPATVPAGAMVTVTNGDAMTHTVTSSEAGAFDVTVAGGATATFLAPTTPGTYDFVCSFHGNMTGTLVVT